MALMSAFRAHRNRIFKGCLCFLDCNPIILLCCFSRCFKAVNTHGRRMKAKPRKHIKLNCSHLIFETTLALTSSPVFPRLYLHEIKRFLTRGVTALLLRSSDIFLLHAHLETSTYLWTRDVF